MPSKVASAAEWKVARDELLKREKAATKLLSELSESRRNLPLVKIEEPTKFKFDTLEGEKTLPDLFDGRKQLALYHFMLKAEDKEGCEGCSFLMDHIPHLSHLNHKETTFVAVAEAPIEKVDAFKKRMGWTFPFYSSGNTFYEGEKAGKEITWKDGDGYFGFTIFLKEGDEVFHTYSTTDRGCENMINTYALLDMTPLGRQETRAMSGIRLHDKY